MKNIFQSYNSIRYYLKIALFIVVVFGFSFYFSNLVNNEFQVSADDVSTTVTVGNTAPVLSGNVAENPASDATTPTNVGANVTFQGTANDSNSENYYLAICKGAGITAVNGGSPTCTAGNWCISGSTSSGSQASCTYTTLVGDTQTNAWYAYVCDGNSAAAACSGVNQGTGSSGSPFNVNHAPTFTAVVDNGGGGADSGANPGGTMTFTSTASDTDNDTVQDQVRLVVCGDTTGATYAGCTGTQICISSNAASNPSCSLSIAAVAPDGNNNYYAYVFDSHQFASTSNYRTGVYVINNVAPTVASVTFNGGAAISLTENTTTSVVSTATVTDNNSCQDLSTVVVNMYRSSATCTVDNNNNCYYQETCVQDGGTCTGSTDGSATYTCTVGIQYHADPTIASTQFPSDTWLAAVYATDNNAASGNASSAGVEMNTLPALNVTASINYGTLNVNGANDPLDKTTTVTNTGNTGLNTDLSGTTMNGVPSGTIAVGQQHYATTGVAYASGTALRLAPPGPDNLALAVLKTTTTGSPQTKNIYWGIQIPGGTTAGTYSGTITVGAAMSSSGSW